MYKNINSTGNSFGKEDTAMTKITLRDAIARSIETMDADEIVSLWNEYCEYDNRMDDYIYGMDMLDEVFQDKTPSELAELVSGNEFNPRNDYFVFDGYGYPVSFDFPGEDDHSPVVFDELAEWVADWAGTRRCSVTLEDLLGDEYEHFFPADDEEDDA